MTETTLIRISKEARDKLQKLAESQKRNMGDQVEWLIEKAAEQADLKSQPQPTQPTANQ